MSGVKTRKRSVSEAAKEAMPMAVVGEVTASDITEVLTRIRSYVEPYQMLLVRSEQGNRLKQMVEGLTSDLERKSIEPIAVMHGIPRRGLQRFIGENGWSHEPLLEQLWREVSEDVGVADGTLIIDASATPKKGAATVGVARQWCGRLGKVDNCVLGVYATYVGKDELSVLVGAELFLPKEWVEDKGRREEAYVPKDVTYRTQPQIAKELVSELSTKLPFEWVLGDDEYGRARHFRDGVAALGKSYAVDVPENTTVIRARKHGGLGDKKWSVKALARTMPVSAWRRFKVRDGEKGPVEFRALTLEVATPRKGGAPVRETLLVLDALDADKRTYHLARAKPGTSHDEMIRRACQRHRIEEVFAETKGEVGLDHFEVRAWHGWYHHMTVCQIAHWFLVREKRRLGEKNIRPHHQSNPHGHWTASLTDADARESGALHQLPPPSERARPQRALQGSQSLLSASSPHVIPPALIHPAQ